MWVRTIFQEAWIPLRNAEMVRDDQGTFLEYSEIIWTQSSQQLGKLEYLEWLGRPLPPQLKKSVRVKHKKKAAERNLIRERMDKWVYSPVSLNWNMSACVALLMLGPLIHFVQTHKDQKMKWKTFFAAMAPAKAWDISASKWAVSSWSWCIKNRRNPQALGFQGLWQEPNYDR